MRSQKGSRKVVIEAVEYRWRATGDDGYISIGIWPVNNVGPYIQGNLRYHETWIGDGDGRRSSAGNQIIISHPRSGPSNGPTPVLRWLQNCRIREIGSIWMIEAKSAAKIVQAYGPGCLNCWSS